MDQRDYEINFEQRKKELTDQLTKRIVAYRKKMKLTQQDIAERTGMKRPNIARVESGRATPTLEVLLRIADSMNLELQIDFIEKSMNSQYNKKKGSNGNE